MIVVIKHSELKSSRYNYTTTPTPPQGNRCGELLLCPTRNGASPTSEDTEPTTSLPMETTIDNAKKERTSSAVVYHLQGLLKADKDMFIIIK